MMIDLENLKIVSESEVPRPRRIINWREIFLAIPVGKALVLNMKEANYNSVKQSLHHWQKKRGEFLNLHVIKRGEITYIVNPKDD